MSVTFTVINVPLDSETQMDCFTINLPSLWLQTGYLSSDSKEDVMDDMNIKLWKEVFADNGEADLLKLGLGNFAAPSLTASLNSSSTGTDNDHR